MTAEQLKKINEIDDRIIFLESHLNNIDKILEKRKELDNRESALYPKFYLRNELYESYSVELQDELIPDNFFDAYRHNLTSLIAKLKAEFSAL